MIHHMKTTVASSCQGRTDAAIRAVIACVLLATIGCGREGVPAAAARGTRVDVVATRLLSADPCRLVTAAEVAEVVGRPTQGVPVRVSSAESLTPSSTGSGCLYELKPEAGQEPGQLSLEVNINGPEMQWGLSAGAGGMFARAKEVRDSVWDWVSGLPAGLFAGRRGQVGVLIAIHAASMSPMDVEPLGALALSRVPDTPFAFDSADAAVAGGNPDPCALITRDEAERELGPLAYPPFRSRGSSAIAHGKGPSCTYYTRGHHVLVIMPTYREGKLQFGIMRDASALAGAVSKEPGATATSGGWDARATGIAGVLYFLKDDRMLEMQYRASSTTEAGAVRLANVAFARL